MIALDELKSTIARMGILADNTDSIEEKMMANMLAKNLADMYRQAEIISNSPQFRQEAEMMKNMPKEKDDD